MEEKIAIQMEKKKSAQFFNKPEWFLPTSLLNTQSVSSMNLHKLFMCVLTEKHKTTEHKPKQQAYTKQNKHSNENNRNYHQ